MEMAGKRGGFSAGGKTSHGNRSFCECAVSQLYCVMSADRPLFHRDDVGFVKTVKSGYIVNPFAVFAVY